MSETYDEANERMVRTLGPRAEGGIRGMGSWSPDAPDTQDVPADDEDPVAAVQGVRCGGITFRSEPPDAIQFIVDEPSRTVTLRVQQEDEPPAVAAGAAGADTCALDLSIDGSGNGVFLPGTINGLAPPLTLSSIPTSGTRYIVLNTTWANAAISGATWSIETTPPPGSAVTQGAPPTSLAILTHVVVDGVPTRVIRCGNILVTPFEAFRTDKTPPLVAGERPWISWYGFQVAP
jgi:hypothetical protein